MRAPLLRLSGAPPFGGRDFEQLVQNVLSLNFVASARTIPSGSAPRDVLDAMLQIHPSDRASIEDLCMHPWVSSCGWLPARIDTVQCELICDDEGPEADSTRGLDKLRKRALPASLRRLLCGAAGPGGAAGGGRVLAVVYAVLCVAAILWSQAGQLEHGVEPHPMFVLDGEA